LLGWHGEASAEAGRRTVRARAVVVARDRADAAR
jgi:hypothetical protein